MRAVAAKIKARQPISDTEKNFVQSSPLSLGLVLKTAVGTQSEEEVIQTYADLQRQGVRIFLHDKSVPACRLQSPHKANRLPPKQGQGDPTTCNPTMVSGAVAELRKLAQRAEQLSDATLQSYAVSVQQASSLLTVVNSMKQQTDEIMRNALAKHFGKSVASYATKN